MIQRRAFSTAFRTPTPLKSIDLQYGQRMEATPYNSAFCRTHLRQRSRYAVISVAVGCGLVALVVCDGEEEPLPVGRKLVSRGLPGRVIELHQQGRSSPCSRH